MYLFFLSLFLWLFGPLLYFSFLILRVFMLKKDLRMRHILLAYFRGTSRSLSQVGVFVFVFNYAQIFVKLKFRNLLHSSYFSKQLRTSDVN